MASASSTGGAASAIARGREPWQSETVVPVFSTTKGMSSAALAVAHSRGLFEYDAPVAAYWPEFAQYGKDRITVRQLLAHQAGLAAIDAPISLQTARDLDALAAAIAPQRPGWQPGARHGYHGMTIGFHARNVCGTRFTSA
jgi:CubicO group peptidase (beta-lactamase class C family)